MRPRLLTIAAAAAFVFAGCGGADESKPEDAKIGSKADFIAAADEICADRDKASLKLARSSKEPNAADLTGRLADIYADTISRMQAVALPPGAARAGAQKYVTSLATMRRPVQRMKAASKVLAGAESAASIKQAAAALQSQVNTVQAIGDLADLNARKYGFKVCGKQDVAASVS